MCVSPFSLLVTRPVALTSATDSSFVRKRVICVTSSTVPSFQWASTCNWIASPAFLKTSSFGKISSRPNSPVSATSSFAPS